MANEGRFYKNYDEEGIMLKGKTLFCALLVFFAASIFAAAAAGDPVNPYEPDGMYDIDILESVSTTPPSAMNGEVTPDTTVTGTYVFKPDVTIKGIYARIYSSYSPEEEVQGIWTPGARTATLSYAFNDIGTYFVDVYAVYTLSSNPEEERLAVDNLYFYVYEGAGGDDDYDDPDWMYDILESVSTTPPYAMNGEVTPGTTVTATYLFRSDVTIKGIYAKITPPYSPEEEVQGSWTSGARSAALSYTFNQIGTYFVDVYAVYTLTSNPEEERIAVDNLMFYVYEGADGDYNGGDDDPSGGGDYYDGDDDPTGGSSSNSGGGGYDIGCNAGLGAAALALFFAGSILIKRRSS
ncbi:MAG: hypothetical protein LBQ58_08835 [Synergistaceae bacterium]|nr:hypothetical protein [Synergistaceae bacterium]